MLTTSEGSRSTMLVLLKPALIAVGVGLSSLFGLIQTSTIAWTSAEADAPGLAGILPEEPPTGLWEDDFLTTGESWEEWAMAASEDVMNLYAVEDSVPLKEQAELLAAVAGRLETIETALADNDYEAIHEPLAVLHGKLKPRYDLANAIFETLKLNPAQAKIDQLNADQKKIGNQIKKAVSYLEGLGGGEAWVSYLKLSETSESLANAEGPKSVLAAVNPIAKKINQRSKLEDEVQQSFLGEKPFLQIVESVNAYRKTNQMKVEAKDMTALRASLAALVASIEQYHESLASQDAAAVIKALNSVKAQALDGGAKVASVVQAHYLNYNLHIVAHETFLDKVVRDKHNESSKVKDYVLGASVSGNQKTETTIGLDVKTSNDGILFDLVLSGVTRSNTAGVTPRQLFSPLADITLPDANKSSLMVIRSKLIQHESACRLEIIPTLLVRSWMEYRFLVVSLAASPRTKRPSDDHSRKPLHVRKSLSVLSLNSMHKLMSSLQKPPKI